MSKAITPIQDIRNNLEKLAPEFAKALPAHVPVKKFIRVAQTAITTNPSLMKCERASLWAALTRAAEVGLMPDGKEAAIVPYKEKAQFMSMIAGKMKLARNSGEIKTLDAQIVYQKDDFKYWIDEDGPHIRHIPFIDGERGAIKCAYGIGATKDGGVYIEVATLDQINAIESASRGQNTPWKGPFRSEMIRKSVMNRLLKRMPTSTDIDMDVTNDNVFSDLNPNPDIEETTIQEKEVSPQNTETPSRLEGLIGDEDMPL